MLYYFSNNEKENAHIFDGLNISKNKKVLKHQYCLSSRSIWRYIIFNEREKILYRLIISNKEVYEIYKQTFISYFKDYTFVKKEDFYQSLVKGDVNQANEILGYILSRNDS